MKCLSFLKLIIVTGLFIMISCNKETVRPDGNEDSLILGLSNFSNHGQFKDFTNDFKSDPIMKLSQAVSFVLNKDKNIKGQLLQDIISNDFREVLLQDFFSQSTNNQGYNRLTFVIDSLYQSDKNDVLNLIDNDCSLISLYIPKEDILGNISEIDSFSLPVRAIFEQENKAYAFIDDFVIEDQDFVGIILRASQEYSTYDESNDVFENFNLSFEDFFGYEISECSSVQSYIQNASQCGGNKIVSMVQVSKLIYNCFGPEESLPNDEGLEEIKLMSRQSECHRGEIEVGLREPQLNNNITNLAAFKIVNEAGFALIDNQALPSSVFLFEFYWLIGRNGEPGNTRSVRSTVFRHDLIKEVYDYVNVPIFTIPVINITISVRRRQLVNLEMKYVPLHFEVFSNEVLHRHWRPDNQGELFWITAFERKTQTSSGTNTNTQSSSTTIGGTLPFSVAKKLSGSLTFENRYTVTTSSTFTVQGVSVIDLGNTFFEYCEPYADIENNHPFFERWRWLQHRSTGFIDIVLDSYWIP